MFFFIVSPFSDLGSLFDLENDLPDELIPSSDLGLVSIPSSGDGGAAGRMGMMVQDAASKHKQLSQLLQSGSSASLASGLNLVSPQPGIAGQVALCKSPFSQGSPSHPSQPHKPVGTPGGQGNSNSPAVGPSIGFSQTILTSKQGHGLLGQSLSQQGQIMNGKMAPVGRGRGTTEMQFEGQTLQSMSVGGAGGPGVSGSGSALAETFSHEAPQTAIHNTNSPQRAGNMNTVRGIPLHSPQAGAGVWVLFCCSLMYRQ